MTEAELQNIISRDEEVSVEFKLESEGQTQLAEVIGAMANADGGWLLVGVNDQGEIVGVERAKTIIDRLHSAAGRVEPSLSGRVNIEKIVTNARKTVISARIPEGLKAIHSVAGVYRIRIGSYNKILTFDQAQALAYRRGFMHYEQTAIPNLKITDLDIPALTQYLSKRISNYSSDAYNKIPFFEILRNLGCAVEEEGKQLPTVTATLFFSGIPDFYVPGAQIVAARFAGITSEKIIDRATLRGPLPKMIDEAAQFIEKNIKHHLELPDKAGKSMTSEEVPEYPTEAYREMIINLVAHRDYFSRVPSHIMIFDNRIIAENPGGLLPGSSLHNLENRHRPRNPRLAEMLHTLNFVERFGSGIGRMQDVMFNNNLPAPEFEADENYFRVTLRNIMPPPRRSTTLFVPAPIPLTPTVSDSYEAAILQKLPLVRLKARQIQGLRYLIRSGRINNTTYRAVTGLAEDASLADLKELMELRILQKVGRSGRSVYYILHPDVEKDK